MIEEIRIRDLGVIEEASVTFSATMNAITGETGAGKTMALTSLSLLMGSKADTSRVRAGADVASVEGTFVVAETSPAVEIVRGAGGRVDIEDDQAIIIVSRQVPRTGRSRSYVGGQSVPLAILQELATHLVTVHGQADQLRLASAAAQRDALDRFGGPAVAHVRRTYDEQWAQYLSARDALAEYKERAEQAGTERLALEALVTRVDAVKPRLGEDEELKSLALRLDNIEALRDSMSVASAALSSDDTGALSLLDSAARELRRASNADTELAEYADRLSAVAQEASEVANELGIKLASLDADPQRLNAIHARRAELNALQKELAMSIEQILERRVQADIRLAEIEDPAAHLERLESELAAAKRRLREAGEALSNARRRAGEELSARVNSELADLAMKDARFGVDMVERDVPGPHGIDDIMFVLAPYAGSDFLPLASTASGGEMSRIMLSLEVVLSADTADADHTFIFDEVDAGIGGSTALNVGSRLARIGDTSQVIVVTHLAQVAAAADTHIVVNKNESAHTTVTDVRVLDADERERELARMLSGHADSEVARTHAAELLSGTDMPR